MGLMGTLAKVAIGYAAARGVDALRKGKGLQGGAKVPAGEAQAEAAPGMAEVQKMIASFGSNSGGLGAMQEMLNKAMSGGGMAGLAGMMGGQTGGAEANDGGLMSSMPQGDAGMAGFLAALGGAATAGGQQVGGLLDQFGVVTTPEAESSAGLLLRAMIQAAKADGEINDAERTRIIDTLGNEAEQSDVEYLNALIVAPVDIEGLAADTPKGMEMQVYSMSLMSIRVDTAAEAQYLDALARALGLNQQTVNALHLQMGVQPLYS